MCLTETQRETKSVIPAAGISGIGGRGRGWPSTARLAKRGSVTYLCCHWSVLASLFLAPPTCASPSLPLSPPVLLLGVPSSAACLCPANIPNVPRHVSFLSLVLSVRLSIRLFCFSLLAVLIRLLGRILASSDSPRTFWVFVLVLFVTQWGL